VIFTPIKDARHIIETAYRLDLAQGEWQGALAREISTRRELGSGLLAYEFDASWEDGYVRIGEIAAVGEIGRFESLTEPVHKKPVGGEYALAIARGTHVLTTRRLIRQAGSVDPESSLLLRGIASAGYRDIWAVCCVNPDATGIAFAIPCRKVPEPLPAALRRQWTQVGVHIAASYRLRMRLASGEQEAPSGIFDAAGRPAHLEAGAVKDREALTQFVKSIDKARAREARGADEDLLELWRGLVAGRWSVFDHIDTDGKHYLVAYENDPEARGPKRLTQREIRIATYAAQGHTNKLIAYEVGIGVSTVATHLRSALHKLGLSRRTELVWLYGQLRGEGAESN
jgi:DNA-binding CsgD family transcriptional regulator